MIVLRSSLVTFQDQHNMPDRLDPIQDEDWPVLKSYVRGVEPFVSASRLLGGEKYPTASSVIPLIDQVVILMITMAQLLCYGVFVHIVSSYWFLCL